MTDIGAVQRGEFAQTNEINWQRNVDYLGRLKNWGFQTRFCNISGG